MLHTPNFEGKSHRIEPEITWAASSKGNLCQDDLDQRIRVADGGVVVYGTATAINEGVQVLFVGWERKE